VIGGKLFDVYGNYRTAFTINMVIAAIAIVGLLFATKPETPPQNIGVAEGLELESAL
jgi:hypothetical protein